MIVFTFIQIFEWCHYMIMSAKCASLASDNNDLSDEKGVLQNLTGDVHALLVET